MLFDTDDNYVTVRMSGGDGKEYTYELLDVVEYEGTAYGVFLPEGVQNGEVAILRLEGNDAQKGEGYVPVNDEAIEQTVFDMFQIKNMDAFDFGSNQFDSSDLL